MEILKTMTLKLKATVLLLIAAVGVAYVAFRRHVKDQLVDGGLEKAEKELQEASDTRLKEEVEKIEAKKEEEILAVETEKKAEEQKLEKKEQETKQELTSLAKKDRIAFREKVDKKLGVKRKGTPGRKPRK